MRSYSNRSKPKSRVRGRRSGPVSSPEAIELWQHLAQVLGMFPSQIRLLDLPAAAPDAALCGGAIDDSVLVEDLVVCGDDEARGADDAVG